MKRFVCFLLAMILIMGMVPATAVTASAASERTTSDKAIGILKGSVTFYSKEEAGKIGYSTNALFVPTDSSIPKDFKNFISKEDADALIRNFMKEKVDKAINKFTKDYNVDLSQQEHDALAVHLYRTGALNPATTSTPFVTARIVKTVSTAADRAAMVNAFVASYGITATNDETLKANLNVAFAEAAMYLYGDYGYNGNSRFAYAVLDKNNNMVKDAADEVVAYARAEGYNLDPLNNTTFLGWYLYDTTKKEITGSPLTKLTNDHDGLLIVAKIHGTGDVDAWGNPVANYIINANTLADLNVYDGDLVKKLGTLMYGSQFKVTHEHITGGVKWVLGSGISTLGTAITGWIKIGKLEGTNPDINKPIATATIKAATPIYPGATSDGAASVGSLKKDDVVNIYETKVEKTNYGNKVWGKITYKDTLGNAVFGWINLVNATVNETKGESGSAEGQAGVIANDKEVNIRSSAGITATNKIATLVAGTKVIVLEMNADRTWAKIKWEIPVNGYTQGWVYMHYVQLNSASQGSAGAAGLGPVLYNGVVTSNINLNVRALPDVYATRVASLPTGTRVNVYELATSRNMQWGCIGAGQWVCTSYLNMTPVNGSGSANNGSTESTTALEGTVTTTTLSVMKHYNNNAEKVGSLKKGDVVTILEKNTENTETGTRIWGRIDKNGVKGWVNLAYLDLKTVATVAPGTSTGTDSSTTNGTPTPAIISDCISVNVRSAAGVYSPQITKLNNGTAVTVYEQITYANAPWARIKWNNGANEGWVCMHYVTLNAGTGSSNTNSNGILNGTSSNTISATGHVNNAYLNVRSGAGLSYAQVGSLGQGTKVTIFEQAVADGMIWGRINYNNTTGWVCMSYITVENASTTGKGVMGTVARCFAKANVRSAPGTANALVSTVTVGSRVEVFETRSHGGKLWGRIAQGWVCMDYIMLDSALPEGEVLDATTAPTTAATVPTVTVNKDNEVKYVINGTISVPNGTPVYVRNDVTEKSDKIGSINNGQPVQILAVKLNGAELWGRVDQYATAGWINMEYVNYSVVGFVNTDSQSVYADPSTSSTVKGTLAVNTELKADADPNKDTAIRKLTLNGETVYGWYQNGSTGLSGWIPMGRVSKTPVEFLPTYKSTTDPVGANLQGKTNAAVTAYTATNSSKEAFYLASGVTVYVGQINLEAGTVWGQVMANGVEGWINMNAVTYVINGTATAAKLNVRTSKDASSDANIIGRVNDPDAPTTLETNDTIKSDLYICELGFDGNGSLWGKLTGFALGSDEAIFNGGWIKMTNVSTGALSILTK